MTGLAAVIYSITLVLVLLGFAVLLTSAWWELCIRLKRERRLKDPPPPWPDDPGWVQSMKEVEK